MTDIAVLGLQVNSSQVTTASAALGGLTAAAQQAAPAVDALTAAALPAGDALNAMSGFATSLTKAMQDVNDSFAVGQRGLDDMRAKFDPLFAAGQKYKQTLSDIKDAHASGALTTDQMNDALVRTKVSFVGQVATIQGTNDSLSNLKSKTDAAAHGHEGLSTQAMAAAHSMRSMVESIIAGQSPLQAAALQLNHLSYAASGPGGLSGAFSEAAGVFTKFLTPTVLLTAGLVGITAAAAYTVSAIAKSEVAFSNLADRAGVSVTALHALQSAAAIKGIDTADFTKGIEQFATLTEQAQHNMGSLAEEFRANGVAAGTLQENFSKAADLIKNAKDDAARYAIIQQLGLPPTAAWVELLKGGSAGIKAAADAAVQLGGEFDENLVKKSKDFYERLNEGWNNFKKYGELAIIEVGGFLTTLEQKSDAFANAVRDKLGINPTKDLSADLGVNGIGRNLGAEAGLNDIGKPKTINVADQKNALSLDNQRIAALGNLATVSDEVRAKQNLLQLAFLAGAGVTSKQSAAILDYTRNLALGVIAIREQTASQELSLATMNMGVGAAAAYTAVQEKVNAARIKGAPLTDNEVASLQKEAQALGRSAQAAAGYKAQLDATFNRSLLGLSDGEQQAAQAMRQLWQGDWQSHMNDDLATFIKVNAALTDIKSTSQDAVSGFVKDLVAGKSAADAFQGALSKIEQKLIDMATNALISNLMKTIIGAGFGGGGVTAGNDPFGAGGLFNTHHTGGIVGSESGPSRALPLSAFIGAPRFHGGGLVGGERAIIAKDGETVLTPGQMRGLAPAGSTPAPVQIVNVHNYSDQSAKTTKRTGSNGASITDVVIGIVGTHMAQGGFDPQLSARTNTKKTPFGR